MVKNSSLAMPSGVFRTCCLNFQRFESAAVEISKFVEFGSGLCCIASDGIWRLDFAHLPFRFCSLNGARTVAIEGY
jgi:hypothetical protein